MAKHQKNTKSDPRIKSFQWPDWSKYLLVVLVFMLYGKTMQYGFVLDDDGLDGHSGEGLGGDGRRSRPIPT